MFIYFIKDTVQGCVVFYENSHNKELKSKEYDCTPSKFVNRLCRYYETDFNGCRNAVRENYGYTQKIPIYIANQNCLLFPLTAIKGRSCVWINYYAIKRITAPDVHVSEIEFKTSCSFSERIIGRALYGFDYKPKEGFSYRFEVSSRVIRRQMSRCHAIDKKQRWNVFID